MQRVTPDMTGEGTVRSSMVSCGDSGDYGELEQVSLSVCEKRVLCSRAVT